MLPYSYHTFLLPFRLDKPVKPHVEGWERTTVTAHRILSEGEAFRRDYAVYRYFTPEARSLLFDSDQPDKVDRKYDYRLQLPPAPRYVIRKTLREYGETGPRDTEVTYTLQVTEVRLLLLSNGIGLLSVAAENREHPDLTAIKHINEYGRRIMPPYLSPEAPHALLADGISLLGVTADMVALQQRLLAGTQSPEDAILDPIRLLIERFVGKDNPITPVIDDRMFVCCLVRSDALSGQLAAGTLDDETLYSVGFVDAQDASCRHEGMRQALLERCVNRRWQGYGTVDVITHHSMVRLTGEADYLEGAVITPFLTQYVQLAAGGLLQRAAIMTFSDRCAHLSRSISQRLSRGKRIGKEDKRLIEQLNADFVDAQSGIFLTQLTAQEQGVETFDILRQELYIPGTLENLKNRLQGLYDLTGIYTEQEENGLLNLIAWLGIPVAAAEIAFGVYAELFTVTPWGTVLALLAGMAAGGLLYSLRFFRRK